MLFPMLAVLFSAKERHSTAFPALVVRHKENRIQLSVLLQHVSLISVLISSESPLVSEDYTRKQYQMDTCFWQQ
jgi:hypothetical protein